MISRREVPEEELSRLIFDKRAENAVYRNDRIGKAAPITYLWRRIEEAITRATRNRFAAQTRHVGSNPTVSARRKGQSLRNEVAVPFFPDQSRILFFTHILT